MILGGRIVTREAARMVRARLLGGFFGGAFYVLDRLFSVMANALEWVNICIRNWRGR